jgi:hypothetical protein
MDGVIHEFWELPRQERLVDSLHVCEDLLCLAKHRLPTAQGRDKEMWVSQPNSALFSMSQAQLTRFNCECPQVGGHQGAL